jgi:hypothetical protein
MEVYTVFAPKACPHRMKPMMRRTTFIIIVKVATESGTRLERTIDKPEMELIAKCAGI